MSLFFKVTIMIVMVVFFALQAMAGQHPKIPLLDANGDNVIEMAKTNGIKLTFNGVNYYKGLPYSPEQTCGSCHDYEAITNAYHFQIGATDLGDDWGKKHPDFHNEHLISAGQYGSW